MPLLLDATIWVASALPKNRFHTDSVAIVQADRDLAALDLTLLEVANAVGVKHRDARRARILCDFIVASCEHRFARMDSDLVEHALEIATEHELSAYDAAYIATARRNDWTLVSADHRDLVSRGLAVAPDAAV